jgi:hypothetical protein
MLVLNLWDLKRAKSSRLIPGTIIVSPAHF